MQEALGGTRRKLYSTRCTSRQTSPPCVPREFRYLISVCFALLPAACQEVPGQARSYGGTFDPTVSSICVQLSYLSACLTGVQPHAGLGSKQRWLGEPVRHQLSQISDFAVTSLCGAENGVLCVYHSGLQNRVLKLAIVFTVL